jgi:predicted SnoaL-like aldol condensation-catalyzing enzyme
MPDSGSVKSLAPPPGPTIFGEPVVVTAHEDHTFLLDLGAPQQRANKRLVYDMWRTILNAGHVEAADQYLAPDYIQHNPTAPTGREAFKQIFSSFVERQDTVPDTIQNPVVTLVAEGDLVILALVTEYPEADGNGTYTSTHFDMFRIENGLIAEHWDSVQIRRGQNTPEFGNGGPVPVVGTQGLAQLDMLFNDDPQLFANKRLAFDLWRHIPEAGREELAPLYVDPIYIQHNPNAATGRDGMMEYFAMRPDTSIDSTLEDPLVAIVAEGDLVVQVLQEERPHPNKPGVIYYVPWFDMFRIKDGRVIEHWDTASKGELPAAMQQ